MKSVGVRKFKADFHRYAGSDDEVLVTRRGKPLALFSPLRGRSMKHIRAEIALQLLELGEGPSDKTSENHDEVLYE